MARFIELNTGSGKVAVNPDHVAVVAEATQDPTACVIKLSDGSEVTVEGRLADVVRKLSS